jgi:hypothetical protein
VSSKLALSVGGVLAIVFGAALTFLPVAMLGGFGLGAPNEAVILSRDVGVTLIGVGILNWMARGATGTALRAILVGNLFIQVAEFVVNAYEIASGALPGAAAGGLVIHVVLAVIFAIPLMRSSRAA